MTGNRHLEMTVHTDDTVTVTNKHGTQLTVDVNGLLGLSPLELMLAALGSCSAVDFALLMRKQRDPVEPLRIEVDGDKEDTRMQWLRVSYHVARGAGRRSRSSAPGRRRRPISARCRARSPTAAPSNT